MSEIRKKTESQVKNPYDPSHTIYYSYFEDVTIADKQAINAQTWLTQANKREADTTATAGSFIEAEAKTRAEYIAADAAATIKAQQKADAQAQADKTATTLEAKKFAVSVAKAKLD